MCLRDALLTDQTSGVYILATRMHVARKAQRFPRRAREADGYMDGIMVDVNLPRYCRPRPKMFG